MALLKPCWTSYSDLGDRVRSWHIWHQARLARAAQVSALAVNEDRFLAWMLDPGNVARRAPGKGKHQTQTMNGRHTGRGSPTHMRGSDLTERVWVCVRFLELRSYTNKVACVMVAEALDWKWSEGKSRRGRPRTVQEARGYSANVQTVRTLANSYRLPGGLRPPDEHIQMWVSFFLSFEDWIESLRPELEAFPLRRVAYERALGADYLNKFLSPDPHSEMDLTCLSTQSFPPDDVENF
jgi:hypothetical protein